MAQDLGYPLGCVVLRLLLFAERISWTLQGDGSMSHDLAPGVRLALWGEKDGERWGTRLRSPAKEEQVTLLAGHLVRRSRRVCTPGVLPATHEQIEIVFGPHDPAVRAKRPVRLAPEFERHYAGEIAYLTHPDDPEEIVADPGTVTLHEETGQRAAEEAFQIARFFYPPCGDALRTVRPKPATREEVFVCSERARALLSRRAPRRP